MENFDLSGIGSCNGMIRISPRDEPIAGKTGRRITKILPVAFSPANGSSAVPEKTKPPAENGALNLQPGEWVQVRPVDEIARTLDKNHMCKGFIFMKEMEHFCGKKFRVFKRVKIMKLESTKEIRELRSPAISLEGVYCSGEHHEGCDRSCFHFWREEWLTRASEESRDK